MKFTDVKFTRFESLKEVVKSFNFDKEHETKLKEFYSGEGIKTDLRDIFTTNDGKLITVLPDGRVVKTIVYISDISSYRSDWGYPKYHIFNCGTLKRMENAGRSWRYKKILRDDGEFFMLIRNIREFMELEICGYCLEQYNNKYDAFYQKSNFNLTEYSKSALHTDELSGHYFEDDCTTIPNIYTKDWPKISKKYKEDKGYRCEECLINLKKHKRFLQTHHINGNKNNNYESSLKALCMDCHSKEPYHSFVKAHGDYKEFVSMKEAGEFSI